MRLSSLPERLRYLQPFRKTFASRMDELNEDSGPAILMPLLSKRVRGLSLADAEQVLSEDFAAVNQWVSDPDQQNDPLQFLLGFSLIASPADLAKLIKEETDKPPQPEFCLHMELPPGAKLRRVPAAKEAGKLVTLKGVWLAIEALSEEAVTNLHNATLRDNRYVNRSEQIVTFGQVTGRKIIATVDTCHGQCKSVGYALSVPGGHVTASISAIGKKVDDLNWDEAPFELCFHTLRIESKLPAT